MERIYAVVQGQVQGVGFRWFVQSLANSLQITGWIRNMENGMVEMELQGETAALHQLLSRIRQGRPVYSGRKPQLQADPYSIKRKTVYRSLLTWKFMKLYSGCPTCGIFLFLQAART